MEEASGCTTPGLRRYVQHHVVEFRSCTNVLWPTAS
jgi:hypothetical protein